MNGNKNSIEANEYFSTCVENGKNADSNNNHELAAFYYFQAAEHLPKNMQTTLTPASSTEMTTPANSTTNASENMQSLRKKEWISWKSAAIVERDKGNHEKAAEFFQNAAVAFKEAGEDEDLKTQYKNKAEYWATAATIEKSKGHHAEAAKFFQIAAVPFKEAGEDVLALAQYNNAAESWRAAASQDMTKKLTYWENASLADKEILNLQAKSATGEDLRTTGSQNGETSEQKARSLVDAVPTERQKIQQAKNTEYVDSLMFAARIEMKNGNYDVALESFHQAITACEQQLKSGAKIDIIRIKPIFEEAALCFIDAANAESKAGNHEKAAEFHAKSAMYYEKLAKVYNNFYDKAAQYSSSAITQYENAMKYLGSAAESEKAKAGQGKFTELSKDQASLEMRIDAIKAKFQMT